MTWPREASELDSFYGNPRGSSGVSAVWADASLTKITPPWRMSYGGAPVDAISIHRQCAESLKRVLATIWERYDRDQAKIDAVHLNEFDGSFNYRVNRNNPAKLSTHSYGCALDLAAKWNPNGKAWVDGGEMMPRAAIEAFKAEGWAWGGQFGGTKDAMHFQATFDPHVGESLPGQVKPPASPPVSDGRTFTNIIATVFGGAGDEQPVAYADVKPGWPERPGCAFPYRFTTLPRRDALVTNVANGKSVVCPVVDVGPWYPSKRGPADPWWLTNSRPRAETDPNTNGAGIDLTPAAARAIGLNGKGLVNVQFLAPQISVSPPSTPPRKDIPVSTPVPTSVLAGIPFDAISGGADQYMKFVPMLVNFMPEHIRGPLRESLDHVPNAQLFMELEHVAIAKDGVEAALAEADAAEAWAKKRRASVAGSQPVDVQGRSQ